MNTDLDRLYAQTLEVGLMILGQAMDSADPTWARAELELLHNIPGLIGDSNPERHRYFWTRERLHYLAWIDESKHDQARSRMLTYHEPIWAEMGPIVEPLIAGLPSRKTLAS